VAFGGTWNFDSNFLRLAGHCLLNRCRESYNECTFGEGSRTFLMPWHSGVSGNDELARLGALLIPIETEPIVSNSLRAWRSQTAWPFVSYGNLS